VIVLQMLQSASYSSAVFDAGIGRMMADGIEKPRRGGAFP
jgi:hypothetical protein